MKILKLFLLMVIFSTFCLPAKAVGDINIDNDNGIYHIVLKGEKSKKD